MVQGEVGGGWLGVRRVPCWGSGREGVAAQRSWFPDLPCSSETARGTDEMMAWDEGAVGRERGERMRLRVWAVREVVS